MHFFFPLLSKMDLNLLQTIKEFSLNILKDNYNSSYVQRTNLKRVIIENITLDNLNLQFLENKTFSTVNELLYTIYILLKCFDAYDKFEQIHKQTIINYLKSVNNNVYHFDINSLIENIITFKDDDDEKKIILKLNQDLKNIFKNLNTLEKMMNIKKDIFRYDDQSFKKAIIAEKDVFIKQENKPPKITPTVKQEHHLPPKPKKITPTVKQEQHQPPKQEKITPTVKQEEEEEQHLPPKETKKDLKRHRSSVNETSNAPIKRKDIKTTDDSNGIKEKRKRIYDDDDERDKKIKKNK